MKYYNFPRSIGISTSIDGSHGLKSRYPILDLPVMMILLGISTIQRGMLGIYGIYMGHVFFSIVGQSKQVSWDYNNYSWQQMGLSQSYTVYNPMTFIPAIHHWQLFTDVIGIPIDTNWCWISQPSTLSCGRYMDYMFLSIYRSGITCVKDGDSISRRYGCNHYILLYIYTQVDSCIATTGFN